MNKDAVALLGAGGHSRAMVSLLRSLGADVAAVYDDSFDLKRVEYVIDIPITGRLADRSSCSVGVIAAGQPERRRILWSSERGIGKQNYIHPSAVVCQSAALGEGIHVMPRVVIGAESRVNDCALINSGAIIEHESTIGDFSHISVGTLICGRVRIGSECFIGAGAVVIDGVSIADRCKVGAGATVLQDISESGTYVGTPARRIS